MTTQITVRLDDENVQFVDRLVQQGHAASRADVVDRALRTLRRRETAQRDAAIYAAAEEDPTLAAFAAHVSAHPVQIDD